MKKHILIAVSFLFAIALSAQNERYTAAMQKGITILDTARNTNTFLQTANHFERIANAEKQAWLPNYYVAYCNMMVATGLMQEEKVEQCGAYLDKAQTALDAAKTLASEESDIYALQGYIYQGRIWDNPMANGAKYSPMSHAALDKAIAINDQNPRPYYLKGQNVLFTPVFYGGGSKNAMPLLQKAAEKFAAYQAPSPLHPNWGAGANKWMIHHAEKSMKEGN
ncbi:MAG: hypothetical protein SH848_10590 [Saprospiraceae bacterium]|nr:hypothetical protein [Saprospiraceae bacterium]MDZ4704368.1 hypothetical protein [Saprospiraceae bacterium]